MLRPNYSHAHEGRSWTTASVRKPQNATFVDRSCSGLDDKHLMAPFTNAISSDYQASSAVVCGTSPPRDISSRFCSTGPGGGVKLPNRDRRWCSCTYACAITPAALPPPGFISQHQLLFGSLVATFRKSLDILSFLFLRLFAYSPPEPRTDVRLLSSASPGAAV